MRVISSGNGGNFALVMRLQMDEWPRIAAAAK
jgi:hypothetical protein